MSTDNSARTFTTAADAATFQTMLDAGLEDFAEGLAGCSTEVLNELQKASKEDPANTTLKTKAEWSGYVLTYRDQQKVGLSKRFTLVLNLTTYPSYHEFVESVRQALGPDAASGDGPFNDQECRDIARLSMKNPPDVTEGSMKSQA